ncbi:MAG: hypothetical protein JOY71_00745 [Acetobacteraceae bacterium]|nr:hypothetical protein [Acetobacteraceae bacterium]
MIAPSRYVGAILFAGTQAFMEWPAPSPSTISCWATGRGVGYAGEIDRNRSDWDRSGEEHLQPLERGIAIPKGRRKLEQQLPAIMQKEEGGFGARIHSLIEDMRAEWCELDRRIAAFDDEMASNAKEDEAARRLETTIPGIGVLNATRWSRRSVAARPSREAEI